MTRTTSVNIRDAPMQKTSNKIITATERHRMARNNIREAPMQKKHKQNIIAPDLYGMTRTTPLPLEFGEHQPKLLTAQNHTRTI